MINKAIVRNNLIAAGTFLLLLSVFAVSVVIFNLFAALLIVIAMIIAVWVLSQKLPMDLRKKITENIFIYITGGAALVMILFVIYILIDIFLIARPQLSWDFITKPPTEGLTSGGIFPAIVGTALLVIIMSVVGVPFGTITAIYLTEYAKENSKIAKFIRFAINTLAGVPAIVFGLFGLGFFIGTIGHSIDAVQHDAMMKNVNQIFMAKSAPFNSAGNARLVDIRKYMADLDKMKWDEQINMLGNMIETRGADAEISKEDFTKIINQSKRPSWGQPALIWAALTMALLTLPVVIISVEEALRAVPKSQREASLALGATKLSTILKIVIPSSITGILTGTILAVSRGAGEVAPILFTGAAYYLPELPKALNSQFMELGYHIYILTTQSTNVEQTLPLQYATTFVLLILTFTLNFSAIFIRSRMRRKLSAMEG